MGFHTPSPKKQVDLNIETLQEICPWVSFRRFLLTLTLWNSENHGRIHAYDEALPCPTHLATCALRTYKTTHCLAGLGPKRNSDKSMVSVDFSSMIQRLQKLMGRGDYDHVTSASFLVDTGISALYGHFAVLGHIADGGKAQTHCSFQAQDDMERLLGWGWGWMPRVILTASTCTEIDAFQKPSR
jgi:hypothetical protein